jgi:hypothetical protein
VKAIWKSLHQRPACFGSDQKTGPFKKIEDFLKVAVFSLLVEEFEIRRSLLGLARSLDVAADLAESPESLMTRIEQQGSRGVMGHQIGVYQDLSRPVSRMRIEPAGESVVRRMWRARQDSNLRPRA